MTLQFKVSIVVYKYTFYSGALHKNALFCSTASEHSAKLEARLSRSMMHSWSSSPSGWLCWSFDFFSSSTVKSKSVWHFGHYRMRLPSDPVGLYVSQQMFIYKRTKIRRWTRMKSCQVDIPMLAMYFWTRFEQFKYSLIELLASLLTLQSIVLFLSTPFVCFFITYSATLHSS